MDFFKLIRPKFAFGLLRNIYLKVIFRGALDINIFKTYFSPGSTISIVGGGKIIFAKRGKRIYVSDGCELRASGGVMTVDEGVFFNRNCTLVAHQDISIGAHCMFGSGVCVFDSDHAFDRLDIPFSEQGYKRSAVSLGSNVWVGANTVITRGAKVGANVVIGANSLVRGGLDGESVYAGNPIRKIRSLTRFVKI